MRIDKLKVLKCIVPISVISTLIIQSVCMLTPSWILTQELMNNPLYVKFNMSVDNEFIDKNTTSGLWIICQNDPGNVSVTCSRIQYFSGDDYIPDPNDSTGAIPYAAKRAALFMSLSTLLLIFGSLLIIQDFIYLIKISCLYIIKCISCRCWQSSASTDQKSRNGNNENFENLSSFGSPSSKKKQKIRKSSVLTFISAISFILSGLLVLAAMVVYISTFKAEIGNKLRPKSSFQGPLFNYRYGYSFYFNIASLLLCEFTGTLLIFLYIKSHQFEWKREVIKNLELASDAQQHVYDHYHRRSSKDDIAKNHIHTIYPISTPMMCLYHHANQISLDSASDARNQLLMASDARNQIFTASDDKNMDANASSSQTCFPYQEANLNPDVIINFDNNQTDARHEVDDSDENKDNNFEDADAQNVRMIKIPEIINARTSTLDSDQTDVSSPVSPPAQFQMQSNFHLQVPIEGLNPNLLQSLNFGNVPLSSLHCRTHSRGRRYSRGREFVACAGEISPMLQLLASPRGSFADGASRRSSSAMSTPRPSLTEVQTPKGQVSRVSVTNVGAFNKRLDFRRQLSIREETPTEEDNDSYIDMIVPPPPPPPSISLRKYASSDYEDQISSDDGDDGDKMRDKIRISEDGDSVSEDAKHSYSCFNIKRRSDKDRRRQMECLSDDPDSYRKNFGARIKMRKKRRSSMKSSTMKTTQV